MGESAFQIQVYALIAKIKSIGKYTGKTLTMTYLNLVSYTLLVKKKKDVVGIQHCICLSNEAYCQQNASHFKCYKQT